MKAFFKLIICLSIFPISTMAQRGQVRGAIHQKYEDEQGPEGTGALNQWLYGNLMNVKVAPEYQFPLSLKMLTTAYKNGEMKSATETQFYINSAKQLFATEIPDNKKKVSHQLSIFDYVQNAFVMMDLDEKTIMAFTLNAFLSKATQDKIKSGEVYAEKGKETDCAKTGKTKTIQGYKCEEYICKNEEKNMRTEMWIASSLFSQNLAAAFKLPMFSGLANTPTGMVLEATTYKNNVLENKMEVKEVNPKANKSVPTAGYSINGK
jgi:hypothetical protein